MKASDPAPWNKNDPIPEKMNIVRRAGYLIPADPLQLGTKIREPGRCGGEQRLMAPLRREIEPEHRLYKLTREATSHRFGGLELVAFIFFGLLVSAATVYCGTELFHMVDSGALEQTVQTLLSK